jgi:hypothetical protein
LKPSKKTGRRRGEAVRERVEKREELEVDGRRMIRAPAVREGEGSSPVLGL